MYDLSALLLCRSTTGFHPGFTIWRREGVRPDKKCAVTSWRLSLSTAAWMADQFGASPPPYTQLCHAGRFLHGRKGWPPLVPHDQPDAAASLHLSRI